MNNEPTQADDERHDVSRRDHW